jgi:hypothetical protein
MRKTKLLFVLAIVLAALSFGFKANAQNTVPVWLNYSPYNWSEFYQTGFYVTLVNNTTSEYYYFESRDDRMVDASTYDLGDVPGGNYTISVQLKPSYYSSTLFCDWWAKDQYVHNITLGQFYDTVLTTSIDLVDYENFELHIVH